MLPRVKNNVDSQFAIDFILSALVAKFYAYEVHRKKMVSPEIHISVCRSLSCTVMVTLLSQHMYQYG